MKEIIFELPVCPKKPDEGIKKSDEERPDIKMLDRRPPNCHPLGSMTLDKNPSNNHEWSVAMNLIMGRFKTPSMVKPLVVEIVGVIATVYSQE